MPRLTGPLFSLTARKTLGKAITYSSWRGVQYARQRVVPTNPNTTAQQDSRGLFSTLNALWLRLGPLARAPWEASASGQPFTDRNRFLQVNIPLMSGQVDMQDFVGSPGVGGAVPPTSVTDASGGAGQITLTAVQPTLPTGWTQTSIDAVAFIDGDPTTPLTPLPFEQQDAAAPFTTVAFTGLPTGTYTWSAWNVLLAPDGTTRYSPSLQGVQIVA
jgi:hypothetical protein